MDNLVVRRWGLVCLRKLGLGSPIDVLDCIRMLLSSVHVTYLAFLHWHHAIEWWRRYRHPDSVMGTSIDTTWDLTDLYIADDRGLLLVLGRLSCQCSSLFIS